MRSTRPRSGTTTTSIAEPALDFGRLPGFVPEFERGPSRNTGFTRVDSLLPQINITKHRLRELEAVHLVREQRNQRRQELAFNARPFVLCGLPLRPLPADQLLYTRRNGKFFLQVLGHPQFGLPYGQDRLIPIWVATLAVRQRSRVVRFGAASEILDFFRLFKDGKRYRRLIEGFQRVFGATMFFGTNDEPRRELVLDWARFHFFDDLRLWFHKTEAEQTVSPNHENCAVLSEAFYNEIDQHRIPVEREVVAALANAPGVLDLYLWLVWKTWSLNNQTARIPLFAAGGLANQIGSGGYSADRFFRRKLSRWLAEVKAFWPHCPAQISPDGQTLIVNSSKKSPAISTIPTASRS
ncbi:MAG: replication protein RepA [Terriglobia bacterium]|jgi:hypothetical protein